MDHQPPRHSDYFADDDYLDDSVDAEPAEPGHLAQPEVVVRATCPSCGDVPVGDVVARVCRTDQTVAFRFRCSTCSLLALKPTTTENLRTLVAGGVPLEMWDLPIAAAGDGPDITWDDVRAFSLSIYDDAEVNRNLEAIGVRPAQPMTRWQAFRCRLAARR